jgi:hypothetical protein
MFITVLLLLFCIVFAIIGGVQGEKDNSEFSVLFVFLSIVAAAGAVSSLQT